MKAIGPDQSKTTRQPGIPDRSPFGPAGEDFLAAIASHRAQVHGATERGGPEQGPLAHGKCRDCDGIAHTAGKLLDVLGGIDGMPQGRADVRKASFYQAKTLLADQKRREPSAEANGAAKAAAELTVGTVLSCDARAVGAMLLVEQAMALGGASLQAPSPTQSSPQRSAQWHGEALPPAVFIAGGATCRGPAGPSERPPSDRVGVGQPAGATRGNAFELSVMDQATHFAPVESHNDPSGRQGSGAPSAVSARRSEHAEALTVTRTEVGQHLAENGQNVAQQVAFAITGSLATGPETSADVEKLPIPLPQQWSAPGPALRTITVELAPEQFGSVRIMLSHSGGTLKVAIDIERREGYDAVESGQRDIVERLMGAGYAVDEFVVRNSESPASSSSTQSFNDDAPTESFDRGGDRNGGAAGHETGGRYAGQPASTINRSMPVSLPAESTNQTAGRTRERLSGSGKFTAV